MKRVDDFPEVSHFSILLAALVLIAYAGDSYVEHFRISERKLQRRFQRSESGEWHDPVVEHTVFDFLVGKSVGEFLSYDGMVLAITVLHDLTQIKHLHCEVRIAEVADLFEVIKATAFLGSKRRSGESQVNHTAVKSDIASRQILTADNDSRRNDGLSRLSVAVHILLGLTCAAPKSLQIGDFTLVKVVFVFIKNNHGVRYLRNTVVHRRNRGDADARRVHTVDK